MLPNLAFRQFADDEVAREKFRRCLSHNVDLVGYSNGANGSLDVCIAASRNEYGRSLGALLVEKPD